MLNRTVYREDETQWRRNKDPRDTTGLSAQEREVVEKLAKHGLKFPYPEDVFYRTHKISRKDLVSKLESSADPSSVIDALYDDAATQGRPGTLALDKSIKVIRQKVSDRQRFEKFARKFGGLEDIKVPGMSYSSFKDLI